MSGPYSFTAFGSDRLPNPAAVPVVQYFGTAAGVTRSPPGFINLGDGSFAVNATREDEEAGCILVVDCGLGSFNRYQAVAVMRADKVNQFWLMCLTDVNEELWTETDPPTFETYRDINLTSRTPPAVVQVVAPYLYSVTPSEADIAAKCFGRLIAPDGAQPSYLSVNTDNYVTPYVKLDPSPGLNPSQLAADALRTYLLMRLPAKCAQLNGLRNAELMSAGIGPWEVTAGMKLRIGAARKGSFTERTLTTGTRTAEQLEAEINGLSIPNVEAFVDGYGRFGLRSTISPEAPATPGAQGTLSCVAVDRDSTGANALFGWAAGGDYTLRGPLITPNTRGVADGAPGEAPDNGQSFWVILGQRAVGPWPDPDRALRRDESSVIFTVRFYRPDAVMAPKRDREGISSCTRAVREVLSTAEGRQLGRASVADIQMVRIVNEVIADRPTNMSGKDQPNFLMDTAVMTIAVRVFQQPPDVV